MDNASVCSDDTDVLINASSCHFADIRTNPSTHPLNFKSDKYLLTEKYVNENLAKPVPQVRPGTLFLDRKYEPSRQYGVPRPLPNSFREARPDHVTNHSSGMQPADRSHRTGSNLNSKYSAELRVSPPSSWRNDKYGYTHGTGSTYEQQPNTPTGIMKSRTQSPPKSVVVSSSTSPKSVKFDEPTNTRFTSVGTDKISRLSVADLDSANFESSMPEIDAVDEKVKEGKEILARLLDSTKKKHHTPKTAEKKITIAAENTSETEEVPLRHDELADGSFTLSQTGSLLHSRDLRDPVFTSTRTDASDEKPALELKEISSESAHEVNTSHENRKLVREIKELKEELSRYQVNSFMEVKSLRTDNDKVVSQLQSQISNLNKQKSTLEDYVGQLKHSLSKKNDRCSELQEQLHEKLTLIHQMSNTESKERVNLENQVNSLQEQKKMLEKQVERMEKSFQDQLDEIKEVERRFESEQHDRDEKLLKKDQEIAFLHHQIESISRKNSSKEVDLKSEMESQIEQAVRRGKNQTQSQINEMKLSLDNEVERHLRLESKHQAEVRSLKANFETLKTINGKLKKEVEVCLDENRQLEKNNAENTRKLREEAEMEADILRKKIISFEKVQRSMALELIEESTKLAVVCGTTPTTSTRQDAFVDCNVLSEAMGVFKEHLEAFRHHVLTLNQSKLSQKNMNTSDNSENGVPNTNVQTSAKLLRHLQNRVQQLRKENAMLRESSLCESCQSEISTLVLNNIENGETVDKKGLDNVASGSPRSPAKLVNSDGITDAHEGSYIETIRDNIDNSGSLTESPKYQDNGPS